MTRYKNKKTTTTTTQPAEPEVPKKKETFWHKTLFYVKIIIVTVVIWGIYFSGLATETSQIMAAASLIQSINMVFGFGTPLSILYLIYRHNHKN